MTNDNLVKLGWVHNLSFLQAVSCENIIEYWLSRVGRGWALDADLNGILFQLKSSRNFSAMRSIIKAWHTPDVKPSKQKFWHII